ncbi:MAG: N-acetylmuramoyl-L-alanine amidase [Burkholderiaceae bacterium]|nr:N-acetylmuramoyl-L-alanine amidase [Burkholderiaceae bacterium]
MSAAGGHDDEGNGRRRLIVGTLALSLAPWQIARGATLLGVRVWPAPAYTRVTLEHDAPLGFNHFALDNPPRLVIDVDGIELNARFKELVGKIDADDPFIAGIRLGQNRPHVVRVVIELKQDVRPQVFSLAPVGPYQHRLVMDLHSLTPVDPLLALLQEHEQRATAGAEPRPATAPTEAADRLDRSTPAERNLAHERAPGARRSTQPASRIITLAIDAGHGGEDPGAVGKRGTYEKNVTLAIARRIEKLAESEPNMRVLMTRDGDYFVPLHQRVARARRVSADLFVSIHADAWIKPDVRGSSVFALSERGATSTAAAWMARRENDADLIGGIDLGTHDAGLARVLLDLSTTAQINDSLKFGNAVLRELERVNQLHKPRVEQAGFAVLRAPDIPSILVETAFISNPEEERRLKDESYQQQLAAAIFAGIKRHFQKHPPAARSVIG